MTVGFFNPDIARRLARICARGFAATGVVGGCLFALSVIAAPQAKAQTAAELEAQCEAAGWRYTNSTNVCVVSTQEIGATTPYHACRLTRGGGGRGPGGRGPGGDGPQPLCRDVFGAALDFRMSVSGGPGTRDNPIPYCADSSRKVNLAGDACVATCPSGQQSNARVPARCLCPAGRQPSGDATQCEPCPARQQNPTPGGSCAGCDFAAGLKANEAKTACVPAPNCDIGQNPELDECACPANSGIVGNVCECDPGFSNVGGTCHPDRTIRVSLTANGTLRARWSGDDDLRDGETVPHETRITFTADPYPGYYVAGWTGCAETAENIGAWDDLENQQCEVAATADLTVAATFADASVCGGTGARQPDGSCACPDSRQTLVNEICTCPSGEAVAAHGKCVPAGLVAFANACESAGWDARYNLCEIWIRPLPDGAESLCAGDNSSPGRTLCADVFGANFDFPQMTSGGVGASANNPVLTCRTSGHKVNIVGDNCVAACPAKQTEDDSGVHPRCVCDAGLRHNPARDECFPDRTVDILAGTNGTVSAQSGGGDLQDDAVVPDGTMITFTAAPAAGYFVSGWTGASGCETTDENTGEWDDLENKQCETVAHGDLEVGATFADASVCPDGLGLRQSDGSCECPSGETAVTGTGDASGFCVNNRFYPVAQACEDSGWGIAPNGRTASSLQCQIRWIDPGEFGGQDDWCRIGIGGGYTCADIFHLSDDPPSFPQKSGATDVRRFISNCGAGMIPKTLNRNGQTACASAPACVVGESPDADECETCPANSGLVNGACKCDHGWAPDFDGGSGGCVVAPVCELDDNPETDYCVCPRHSGAVNGVCACNAGTTRITSGTYAGTCRPRHFGNYLGALGGHEYLGDLCADAGGMTVTYEQENKTGYYCKLDGTLPAGVPDQGNYLRAFTHCLFAHTSGFTRRSMDVPHEVFFAPLCREAFPDCGRAEVNSVAGNPWTPCACSSGTVDAKTGGGLYCLGLQPAGTGATSETVAAMVAACPRTSLLVDRNQSDVIAVSCNLGDAESAGGAMIAGITLWNVADGGEHEYCAMGTLPGHGIPTGGSGIPRNQVLSQPNCADVVHAVSGVSLFVDGAFSGDSPFLYGACESDEVVIANESHRDYATCQPLVCGGKNGFGEGERQTDGTCACPEGTSAVTGDGDAAGLCAPAALHSAAQECSSKGWTLNPSADDSFACEIKWRNAATGATGDSCAVAASVSATLTACSAVFGDPPTMPYDAGSDSRFVYNCGAGMHPGTFNLGGATTCGAAPLCDIGDNPSADSCVCPPNSAAPSGGTCACASGFFHVSGSVCRPLIVNGACAATDDGAAHSNSAFVNAARFNNLSALCLQLARGANVNADSGPGLNRKSAMHYAVQRGDLTMLAALLAWAGVNVHIRDGSGNSLLMEAVNFNRPEMIPVLLKAGVDSEVANNFGNTALSNAKFHGNPEVIAALLVDEDGACRAVDDNACPLPAGQTGCHPLDLIAAAGNNELEELCLILARGVDVNHSVNGNTPLHWAAQRNHVTIVAALLGAAGVSVNAVNNQGDTPLHDAAGRGYAGVVSLLLAARGIDPNIRNVVFGETALMEAATGGFVEIVKALLAVEGADPNVTDDGGRTALILAVQNGRGMVAEVVAALLAFPGTDANARTTSGATALTYGAQNNLGDIVKALLAVERVSINAGNYQGDTALIFATRNGNADMVDDLLEIDGIDVTLANNNGDTALSTAKASDKESAAAIAMALRAAGACAGEGLYFLSTEDHSACFLPPPCELGQNPPVDRCACPANSAVVNDACACDAEYLHVTSGDNAGTCQLRECGLSGTTQTDGTCQCAAGEFNFRHNELASSALCGTPSVSDLSGEAATTLAIEMTDNCPAEAAVANPDDGDDFYLTCGSPASPLVTLSSAIDSESGTHVGCVIGVRGTVAATVTGPACADVGHAGSAEKLYDREAGMYSELNPFFYGDCAGDDVLVTDSDDGNYGTCQPCPVGTVRDGFVCADIDECEPNNGLGPCDANATCANAARSGDPAICKCNAGHSGTGRECFPDRTVYFESGAGGTLRARREFALEGLEDGETIPHGTRIIFTAAPDDGYYVSEWSGWDVCGRRNNRPDFNLNSEDVECDGRVESDLDVTVTFADIDECLTLRNFCDANAACEDSDTPGAEPDCECGSGFSGNGRECFPDRTVNISRSANGTVSAEWSGDDDLRDGETVPHGTTITFTAAPDDDYFVSGWSGCAATAENIGAWDDRETKECEAPATSGLQVSATFADARVCPDGRGLRQPDGSCECPNGQSAITGSGALAGFCADDELRPVAQACEDSGWGLAADPTPEYLVCEIFAVQPNPYREFPRCRIGTGAGESCDSIFDLGGSPPVFPQKQGAEDARRFHFNCGVNAVPRTVNRNGETACGELSSCALGENPIADECVCPGPANSGMNNDGVCACVSGYAPNNEGECAAALECEAGENPETAGCYCPTNSVAFGGACVCDSQSVRVVVGDDAGTCQPRVCEDGTGERQAHGGCRCPDGQTAIVGTGGAAGFCADDALYAVAQACEDSGWGIVNDFNLPGYFFCAVGSKRGNDSAISDCRIGTRAANETGTSCAEIFDLSGSPPVFPQKRDGSDSRVFAHNCGADKVPELLNRDGATECEVAPPCDAGSAPNVVGDACEGCPQNGGVVDGVCACDADFVHVVSGDSAGSCRPQECGGDDSGAGRGEQQPDGSCACGAGKSAVVVGDDSGEVFCVPSGIDSAARDCAAKGWTLGFHNADSLSCAIEWRNESGAATGNDCHITASGATAGGGNPACADIFGSPTVFPKATSPRVRYIYNCGAGMFPETVNLLGETACASSATCAIGQNPTNDNCICPANSAAQVGGGACECDNDFVHVTSGDDAGTCQPSACEDDAGERQADGSCECPEGKSAITGDGSGAGKCVVDEIHSAVQSCSSAGWVVADGVLDTRVCRIKSRQGGGAGQASACSIVATGSGFVDVPCTTVFGDPPAFPNKEPLGDRLFVHSCGDGMIPKTVNRNGETECAVAPPCAVGQNPDDDDSCAACPADAGIVDGVCECDSGFVHITSGGGAGTCAAESCGAGGTTRPDGACECPAGELNLYRADPSAPAVCATPLVSDLSGAAAVALAAAMEMNCPVATRVVGSGAGDAYLTCGDSETPLASLRDVSDPGAESRSHCVIAVRGNPPAGETGPACADLSHAGGLGKLYDRGARSFSDADPFFHGECAGGNVLETDANSAGYGTCRPCGGGTARDGFICADIDECETNNGGCDANASCENAERSGDAALCECNPGHSGDGRTCAACAGNTFNPTAGGSCMVCENGGTVGGLTNGGWTTCACAGDWTGTTCDTRDSCPANSSRGSDNADKCECDGGYRVAAGSSSSGTDVVCELRGVSVSDGPNDGGAVSANWAGLTNPIVEGGNGNARTDEAVTFTATPEAGYYVSGWTGDCDNNSSAGTGEGDNTGGTAKSCVVEAGSSDVLAGATFAAVRNCVSENRKDAVGVLSCGTCVDDYEETGGVGSGGACSACTVSNSGSTGGAACGCVSGFADPDTTDSVLECAEVIADCLNSGRLIDNDTDCDCSTSTTHSRNAGTKLCTVERAPTTRAVTIEPSTNGNVVLTVNDAAVSGADLLTVPVGAELVFSAVPANNGYYVSGWTGACGPTEADGDTGENEAAGATTTCTVPAGSSDVNVGATFAAVRDCGDENRKDAVGVLSCGTCVDDYEETGGVGSGGACSACTVSNSGSTGGDACGCDSGFADPDAGTGSDNGSLECVAVITDCLNNGTPDSSKNNTDCDCSTSTTHDRDSTSKLCTVERAPVTLTPEQAGTMLAAEIARDGGARAAEVVRLLAAGADRPTALQNAIDLAAPTEAEETAVGDRQNEGVLSVSYRPAAVAAVELLLTVAENAADPNAALPAGQSPLVYALSVVRMTNQAGAKDGVVVSELAGIVSVLLDNGANPNADGGLALHYATRNWPWVMGGLRELARVVSGRAVPDFSARLNFDGATEEAIDRFLGNRCPSNRGKHWGSNASERTAYYREVVYDMRRHGAACGAHANFGDSCNSGVNPRDLCALDTTPPTCDILNSEASGAICVCSSGFADPVVAVPSADNPITECLAVADCSGDERQPIRNGTDCGCAAGQEWDAASGACVACGAATFNATAGGSCLACNGITGDGSGGKLDSGATSCDVCGNGGARTELNVNACACVGDYYGDTCGSRDACPANASRGSGVADKCVCDAGYRVAAGSSSSGTDVVCELRGVSVSDGPNDNGAVSASWAGLTNPIAEGGSENARTDEAVTFTATPDSGYYVSGWTGDCLNNSSAGTGGERRRGGDGEELRGGRGGFGCCCGGDFCGGSGLRFGKPRRRGRGFELRGLFG